MNPKSWWRGPKGEWYVVIQFMLFALIAFGPRSLPSWSAWAEPWQRIGTVTGLLLAGIGAILILAGVLSLGSNLTAVPHPKENASLVQTGAYRFVRHPIYSGLIFAALGWGFLRHSILILLYALILFLFFDIKSRREEQWLANKFADYATYQQRVRKLIPFLY